MGIRGWRAAAKLAALAVAVVALAASMIATDKSSVAMAASRTVHVGQQNGGTAVAFQFNRASILVQAGDTVDWSLFSGGSVSHNVTSYAETAPGTPEWASGTLCTGGLCPPGSVTSFDRAFTTPGVYTYYCSFHALRAAADPANIDANIAAGFMVGKITVTAASVGGLAVQPSFNQDAPAESSSAGTGFPMLQLGGAAIGVCLVLLALFVARRRA
jgi:plastocyanin